MRIKGSGVQFLRFGHRTNISETVGWDLGTFSPSDVDGLVCRCLQGSQTPQQAQSGPVTSMASGLGTLVWVLRSKL